MVYDDNGRGDDDHKAYHRPNDPREVVVEKHRLFVLVKELAVDIDGDSLVVVLAVHPDDVVHAVNDSKPPEDEDRNEEADNERTFGGNQPFDFERDTDT